MGQEPVYVTRDQIVSALDVKPTAYMYIEVDRACRAGSRGVEGLLHRVLYPEVKTRSFDWPAHRRYTSVVPSRIDFDKHALISATSVTSGSSSFTENTHYFLEPNEDGPPYESLDLNRSSSAAFSGGPQRAVVITGLWGWTNDEETVGTLVGSNLATDTLITLSAPAGVGTILRIGTERLQVAGQRWLDSTQTATALALANNAVSITVSNGALFTEGELLLLDSERVQVLEVAGNVLTLRRAVGGTVLATHGAATPVYWQHRVQVERGSLGTTAAAGAGGAPVYRWVPPTLVTEVAQAYAEDFFLQRNAGYSRTVGQGDAERPASGRGIQHVENRCRRLYGRGVRLRSV
jgi:hypothetical protein